MSFYPLFCFTSSFTLSSLSSTLSSLLYFSSFCYTSLVQMASFVCRWVFFFLRLSLLTLFPFHHSCITVLSAFLSIIFSPSPSSFHLLLSSCSSHSNSRFYSPLLPSLPHCQLSLSNFFSWSVIVHEAALSSQPST